MNNFLVVARSYGETHEKYIKLIKSYIEAHGGTVLLDVVPNPPEGLSIPVPDGVECIITVGGDGTVVRAAQDIERPEIPVVGLNCGHLGYLCDMTVDNVEHCLDQLLSDNCKIEKRMMLEGTIDGGEPFRSLNDIVVSSKNTGISVLDLTVSVNGIKLYSHNCDGLIVATPTGSTAYNLSANGPIVSPHSDCIILTPINPHTLNSRSIILASSDEIEIKLGVRHETDGALASVIFDGVNRIALSKDAVLKIHKSTATTKMVMLENVSFLERIRARMQEI